MSSKQTPNTSVVAMDTQDDEDLYANHAFVSDANHFGSSDHISEAFHCPITHDIMVKPVVLVADGTTYEESALKDWLSENNISPLTGMELATKEYRPNYALQHAIGDYLKNKEKKKQKQQKVCCFFGSYLSLEWNDFTFCFFFFVLYIIFVCFCYILIHK